MIEKIKKTDAVPFTQVANSMLCDPTVSLKAKGLLAYMLSKPPEWIFNVRQIATQLLENKDTVARIILDLISAGYVSREDIRNDKGRIVQCDYTVRQSPCLDYQDTENQDTLNKERERNKKGEGEANDLDTSKSRETEEAPSEAPSEDTTPTVFSKKVEQTLNEYAPGTKIDAETRKAIGRFGETYGIDALSDAVLEYTNEKERDKIRKYCNTDLPERLADATLNLYVPPPKKRPEPKEMPTFAYACPRCGRDQSHEVKTNSSGCHACGHDYGTEAGEHFREVASAEVA